MRTPKYRNLTVKLGIPAALVLLLALVPFQAMAADTDWDGFPDARETGTGLVLPPGASSGDPGSVTFPPCTSGADPSTCVDFNRIDLFVILRQPADTKITATPLQLMDLISRSFADFGLDISIHPIDESLAGPDREVYCIDGAACTDVGQKAVRITEVTSIPQAILGYCPQGTPMGLDDATVYTGEIERFVKSTCGIGTTEEKTCQAYVGEDIPANLVSGYQNVIDEYIEYVTIHEIGHTMELALDYNRRFGGNHSKTGTGFIMDQTAVLTDKKGTVTFYFPAKYSALSQGGALLY